MAVAGTSELKIPLHLNGEGQSSWGYAESPQPPIYTCLRMWGVVVESTKPQTEVVLVGGTRVRSTANVESVRDVWLQRGGLMSLEVFDGHGRVRPALIPSGAVVMLVALR